MLIITNDPAGITGRSVLDWDCSLTLQQNIELHLSGGADCEVRINGGLVDPVTDPRMDRPPAEGDTVVISRRPAYGVELAAVFYVVYAAALIYLIANMPRNSGADQAGNDSPNNKLTGQSNVARAYQAIPDVYGYRRVWPDLIQPSIVEYVDNVKYVTEWLCVSRGKGTVSDVQYAETPIGDIAGSSYELFEPVPADGYPEFGATTVNDLYETFASDDVNGQELPYAYDYPEVTRNGDVVAIEGASTFTVTFVDGDQWADLKGAVPSGTAHVEFEIVPDTSFFDQTCTVLSFVVAGANVTFTFSSAPWAEDLTLNTAVSVERTGILYQTIGPFTLPRDADQIWWSVVFLRGLQAGVGVRAEWWRVDAGGVEVPGTRESEVFGYDARTYDQMFYTTKVTPAAGLGRYRIQFTRLSTQQDPQGADVAKLEEVYAVRYFPTRTLPGVTVLRVTTKATLSATGFSDRKFNLRWLRHVRSLTSSTLSPSRNFARSLAHVWTLARNPIEEIDTEALSGINDEHGENSPLLRFDCSLDDKDMSLGERMHLIASTARGMVWRDGLRWTVTREQSRPFPQMQLDYRNLAAKGESLISYSAHLPASNDGVQIEYADEETQARKSYVRLNISSGVPVEGISNNPKKIVLQGCTTEAQASNRAQLEARRLLYQRMSVTDTALCDGGSLGPLSVIRWIDPNDFGGDDGLQAGEVTSLTGGVITTSETVDWKGESTGRILFTGEDGRYLGSPVLCTPTSTGIQLASVPAGLYVADEVRQCGSRYAFAVGLTEDEIASSGLYLTTEVKPAGDGTVSLAFAQYDERLYEGDA